MSKDSGRVSRRQFLYRSAGTLAGLVFAQISGSVPVSARPLGPAIRSGQWALQAGDFAVFGRHDAGPGRQATAISPSRRLPFAFNALGAAWESDSGDGGAWEVEFRTSMDGESWSQWTIAPSVREGSGKENGQHLEATTDVVGLNGRWAQVRLRWKGGGHIPHATAPVRLVVTYIDSARGARRRAALPFGSTFRPASATPPSIVSRAEWGADESLRFSNGEEVWPPSFTQPEKIILHHTVTSNDDSDPAATVRAIYYYHAVVLEWGDIGYNYLVDQDGTIYEGRAGGPGVEGGHAYGYNRGSIGIGLLGNFQVAPVPEQQHAGLQSLIARKAADHALDPEGSGFFVDDFYPNIAGHRDFDATACPGDNLEALLPSLRSGAAIPVVPDHRVDWLQNAVPDAMPAGSTVQAQMELRNVGGDVWTPGEPNPYRIGYRWYDETGQKHNAEPDLEIHTDLPGEVLPGDTVDLPITLQAPMVPGRYRLYVDMVHELVTWFEDDGGRPLWLDVTVQ